MDKTKVQLKRDLLLNLSLFLVLEKVPKRPFDADANDVFLE
jgi:hypothetical protein